MKTESSSKPQAEPVASHLAPIVLIHGLWGDKSQFNDWHNKFPGHKVIAMDLYGHGAHKGNLNRVSLKDYALNLIPEIKKLGTKVIIAGQSAGGLLGQLIASMEPDLVKELILIASDPPKEVGVRIPFQWAFVRWWLILAAITGRKFHLRKKSAELVRGTSDAEFGPESGLALFQILTNWYSVPKLRCKVTVIAASRDQFLPVTLQKLIADYYDAQYIVLTGDHMFHCSPLYRNNVIETVQQILCGDFEDRVPPTRDPRTVPAVRRPAWSAT